MRFTKFLHLVILVIFQDYITQSSIFSSLQRKGSDRHIFCLHITKSYLTIPISHQPLTMYLSTYIICLPCLTISYFYLHSILTPKKGAMILNISYRIQSLLSHLRVHTYVEIIYEHQFDRLQFEILQKIMNFPVTND